MDSTQVTSADPYGIELELANAPRPAPGRRSNIVEFYANRSVLITGASGFIGKVLIEKLIRTCPSIKRIFVLIRSKWNKTPEERLRELLDTPLFDGVRDQKLHERVLLVEGDVTQPNLGLDGNNLSRIINEVTVIFHSAATVKFDEPLKQSVAINIAGTKNMIEICRRIPQLAGLVHVSTAYANCDRDHVDEHIYPLDMDPEKLIQMADWLDQDTLQELKQRLLGARPNTYTYTKALAEWLLVRSARDLPVVVCRPSIVVATRHEPFKGWIDNVNGPTGVILGAGKGLIRSMFAEKSFIADLIPVDVVINLVVTLGWFAHINKGQKHLNEAAESFTESLLSGRSSSPSTSAGSNSSAASTTSGDENYDIEHDSLIANNNDSCQHQSENNNDCDTRAKGQQKQLDLEQQQQKDLRSERRLKTQSAQQMSTATSDDGYISMRSSNYNSVASSDTASTSSSASMTNRNLNHRVNTQLHQHRRRQPRPAIKITNTTTTTKQQQQKQCKLVATNANDGLIGDEMLSKLRLFRQRTKAKLNANQLPEEYADVPVFNCTSGSEIPVTWGQVQMVVLTALSMFPCSTTFRYPCGSFTNNKFLDDFYRLTLHYIPGYIVDFVTKLIGGKPIMVRIFSKFDQAANVLKAFTSKQWQFNYDNKLFLLSELMNEEDKRLFNFDISSMNWELFLHDYVLGVRKFMLKESMESLEQARSNLRWTYYRNLSLQLVATAAFTYCFVSMFT